jgi:hypothetical protein
VLSDGENKKNPRRKQFVTRLLKQMHTPRRRRKTAQQSIRKSQQCVSNTQKDQRCRKRTAHTQKCWIHLAKQNNLRIKPSNIPNAGKVLFTWKKPIPRDTLISKYTGRKISKKELDKKYGDGRADYAVCNKRGRCVDATYTMDAAARFVNDSRGTSFENNSKMKGNQIFKLKATKQSRQTTKYSHHMVVSIGNKRCTPHTQAPILQVWLLL